MVKMLLERVRHAGDRVLGGGAAGLRADLSAVGERPAPAERTGPSPGEMLAWFMRFVGLLWLAKGLMHWSVVLGVSAAPGRGFDELPAGTQAATILFSVIDLIAGVGLWMVSAWGGVVWIVAAGLHAALDILAPHIFGRQFAFVTAVVVLIAVYALLTALAARETRKI